MLSITKSNLIILVLLFSGYFFGYSQITNQNGKNISQAKAIENELELKNVDFLEKCSRDSRKNNLPYFLEQTILKSNNVPSFYLENTITRELDTKELELIKEFQNFITASI